MRLISFILFAYLVALGIVFFIQEKLIFFPQKLEKNHPFRLPAFAKEIQLKTADNIDISAIFYEQPNNKKVILYFHGNAGSLENWKGVADELLALNCNVFILDYRGYGKSGGKISEKGFYQDGETAYQYLKKQGYEDKNIIFYGRSLGAGVAVELALHHPVGGLILETPYLNFPALAMKTHWYFLPNILLRYRFDNAKKIQKLQLPILIIHGDNDQLVSVDHGKKLYEMIKGSRKIVIIPRGSHDNLSDFPEHAHAIQEFLKIIQ